MRGTRDGFRCDVDGSQQLQRCIPRVPRLCRPPKAQVIPVNRIGDYLRAADEGDVLSIFYPELASGLRRGELLALLWSAST